MAHIYKCEEWESNGRWHCGDVSALAANSNLWWYAPNILGITPVEYVHLLIDKFNAIGLKYEVKYDVLMFSFRTQADCRKYKNFINAEARRKNFVTY